MFFWEAEIIPRHRREEAFALGNEVAQKVVHSDDVEEPLLVPGRTIQSKVL